MFLNLSGGKTEASDLLDSGCDPDAPVLEGAEGANAAVDIPDFFAAEEAEEQEEEQAPHSGIEGASILIPTPEMQPEQEEDEVETEPEPMPRPEPEAEQQVAEMEDAETGSRHGERSCSGGHVEEDADAAASPAVPESATYATAASTSMSTAPRGGSDTDGLNPSDIVSGKRKVRPTTVMVDGYAVKRQNNYSMDEGEGSVWDRELSAGGIYADPAFAYRDREVPPPAAAAPRTSKEKSAASREQTSEEKQRLKRNDQMKLAKHAQAQARLRFLEPHWQILAHFGAKLPHVGVVEKAAAAEAAPGNGGASGGFVEDASIVQPREVQVEMRDYQLRGLRWLVGMHKCGVNAILADEMGLGKTLQTIAFLAHLKFVEDVHGPHLVICPLSVLSSWMTELKRFCPELRALKLHSSDLEERRRLMQSLGANCGADVDVVVTTYEMAKSPAVQTQLSSRSWWRYLIIDEGHVIKNHASQISQAVRRFHFSNALLLTGTPLQNNLHELWALLNFLYEDLFPSSAAFDKAFQLNSTKGATVDNEQLSHASQLLRPFMLRRTKEEVEKSMPPKLETTIGCPLSEMQLFWYKRLLLRESALLKELEQANEDHVATGTDWKRLSSLLMQLRKCCNHPFLFPGAEPSSEDAYVQQLIDGSGKFQLLDRLLAKLFEAGHRVVLFSQFTSTLDLLEDLLTYRKYKYCRLDGSTNRVQRTVDINAFNMKGSTRFCFLMSTRAGGLGINCQTADTCILFDSDWNPQVDLQAMARVHRIGQTKVVHLYRLVSKGTVEERIVQRAEKKLYLDRMVNRGSSAQAESMDELSDSEMMNMLKVRTARARAALSRSHIHPAILTFHGSLASLASLVCRPFALFALSLVQRAASRERATALRRTLSSMQSSTVLAPSTTRLWAASRQARPTRPRPLMLPCSRVTQGSSTCVSCRAPT